MLTSVFTSAPALASERGPVKSLLELRTENMVLQQWDTSCGAAALATLLVYQHGQPVSEREIAQVMLNRGDPLKVKLRGGFSLLDMKRYVDALGLQGAGYQNLKLNQLQQLGPAIIPVHLGDYNHFVVYRGLQGDQVLLADPAFGNRVISREQFEAGWLQRIAFVVKGAAASSTGQPGPAATDAWRVPSAVVRQAIR